MSDSSSGESPPTKKQKRLSNLTTKTHKAEKERLFELWKQDQNNENSPKILTYVKIEKNLVDDTEFFRLFENGTATKYLKCNHLECSDDFFKQHFANETCKKSTAVSHATRNHKKDEDQVSQESPKRKIGKKRTLTSEEKVKISEQMTEWIIKLGIPIVTIERNETKKLFEFLVCDILGFSHETFEQIPLTRYSVYKTLKSRHEKIKVLIQENGIKLAEEGRLFIMNDHWFCKKSSTDLANKYHGLILGVRKNDGCAVSYMLRFNPADYTTQAQVEKEVTDTLEEYGLLAAFQKKIIPVVSDAAINWGKQTDLFVVCMPHTISRIKKRLTEHKKYANGNIPGFASAWKTFKNFCKEADVVSEKNTRGCHRSYTNYIWNIEVNDREKLRIAQIRHDDFESLPEITQNKVLEGITQYPLVKNPNEIRFNSTEEQLQNLLENKKPIQDLRSDSSSQHHDLIKEFDFDWPILEASFEVLKETTKVLKFFEKFEDRTMSQFLPKMINLLNWSLKKQNNVVTRKDKVFESLKEQLAEILSEYIFGDTHIDTRASSLAIAAAFFDKEFSMQFRKTEELLVYSNIASDTKRKISAKISEAKLSWPRKATDLIRRLDSELNDQPRPCTITVIPLEMRERLGYSDMTELEIESDGSTKSIEDEIFDFRNFRMIDYLKWFQNAEETARNDDCKRPVEFMKFHQSRFPRLEKISRVILNAASSSSEIERTFSTMTRLLTAERNRLSFSTLLMHCQLRTSEQFESIFM